jgi:hypothetical protein
MHRPVSGGFQQVVNTPLTQNRLRNKKNEDNLGGGKQHVFACIECRLQSNITNFKILQVQIMTKKKRLLC